MERLRRASNLGFDYIEWLFPYQCSIQRTQHELTALNLKLILINAALGDPSSGDKGIGAVPGREEDFKRAMDQAFEYANALKVPMIHVMAGVVQPGDSRTQYIETFVENLNWANEQLTHDNVSLLIEPLNRVDTPNYLHATCQESIEILDSVHKEIGLQFDFYHLQIMEGNLGQSIKEHLHRIRHVQFSSLPGRHEPQFGEVNCFYLFDWLEELGYDGFVGCEYSPMTTVEEGLHWRDDYLARKKS